MSNDTSKRTEVPVVPAYSDDEDPKILVKLMAEFHIPLYDNKVVAASALVEANGFYVDRVEGDHLVIMMDMSHDLDLLKIYEALDNISMYGKILDT